MQQGDALSVVFFALADPTRRAILRRLLTQGDASVAELAAPFDVTPRAISKQVRVLEDAGLVTRGRDAQRRPSRIRLEPLAEVDAWLEDYRAVWLQRFAQLAEQLEAEVAPDEMTAATSGDAERTGP